MGPTGAMTAAGDMQRAFPRGRLHVTHERDADQEPAMRHRMLGYSDDYTVIEIAMPADLPTVGVAP